MKVRTDTECQEKPKGLWCFKYPIYLYQFAAATLMNEYDLDIEKYRRTNTTVSLINYHFVFCPRNRRKNFLNTGVEERIKELVQEIYKELEIVIVTLECDKDHAHLSLSTLPKLSPADIMAKIKRIASKKLREEFPHLRQLPSLRTRSYFVSTAGNVSSATVTRYVEEQKTRG